MESSGGGARAGNQNEQGANVEGVGPASAASMESVESNSMMQLYDDITKGFDASRRLDGKIDPVKFGEVATMIAPLYDRIFGIGFVSNHLKNDIIFHGKGLMEEAKDYDSVESLISTLVREKGLETVQREWNGGVLQCLWTKRALDFIQRFLEYTVITYPQESLHFCASKAYEEVLKPYHGFMVSTIVQLAFNLAPTRENFLVALGFDHDLNLAREKLSSFTTVAKPVILQVHRILQEHNCNFNDKV